MASRLLHFSVLILLWHTVAFTIVAQITELADVHQGLGRSGRGAGARPGEWGLRLVESGDLPAGGGWPGLDGLREIEVDRNFRTERHLLRPFDVLVAARAESPRAALVPPGVSRTVAGVTLLVVRPKRPDSGLGHWIWWFLSSAHGQAQLARRLTVSSTITSLSANSLREVEVPVPSARELHQAAELVEASEAAYEAAVEAARLRREALRDSLIREIGYKSLQETEVETCR